MCDPLLPLRYAGLAQQGLSDQSTDILWSLGYLALAVLALVVVSLALRKLLLRQQTPEAGLTLGELRKMRDSGQLSDEEFEAARQAVIAQAGGGTGPPPATPDNADPSAQPDQPGGEQPGGRGEAADETGEGQDADDQRPDSPTDPEPPPQR